MHFLSVQNNVSVMMKIWPNVLKCLFIDKVHGNFKFLIYNENIYCNSLRYRNVQYWKDIHSHQIWTHISCIKTLWRSVYQMTNYNQTTNVQIFLQGYTWHLLEFHFHGTKTPISVYYITQPKQLLENFKFPCGIKILLPLSNSLELGDTCAAFFGRK